jgi:ketoreductase RED1
MTITTLALGSSAHVGAIAERARKPREPERVCVICAPNPRNTGRRVTLVGAIIAEQRRRRSQVSDNAQPHYREAAVVGGGVIGVSWSALFLAHGLGVTVADPLPDIADRVRAGLREIAPTLAQLDLPVRDLTDDTGALKLNSDVAAAVAEADVVQENGPERADVKQQLWADIERGAPARALFASSSSSIPASVMSTTMRQPGRLIVGHPFNPPHLVPLVEVVPSTTTDAAVVSDAVAFYQAMGKRPQVLRREIPGFVANRLQAALFREAVHLVSQGVVTEQELDAVVTTSIGMRWAVAGPFQTFHLGGGPGGLPDFLVHLGPAMAALWSHLGSPTLDGSVVERLTDQAEHFDGSVAELALRRDDAQIRLMRALDEIPAVAPSPRREAVLDTAPRG